MPSFRAAILDFDGLILETEGACWVSWRALFRERGAEFTLPEYQQIVGSDRSARTLFEDRCGRPADWGELDARRRELERRLHEELELQPGVAALLQQARALGMAVGVASSSSHGWVDRLLAEHGVLDRFDAVVCREDAPHAKPEPDLYLEAARRLGAAPAAAVAFEDSLNGALAARRAGVRCVAVPTAMTATQDFSAADLVVPTLEGLDLRETLARLARAA